MADKTGIEWTDATWNPIRGCTRVSEGCRNCYAEIVAARFSGPGQAYHGLATRSPARWTGDIVVVERLLDQPLRWRRPRKVFANSMSDLFHEKLARVDVARIWAHMVAAHWHTFQVLTKRPDRAYELLNDNDFIYEVETFLNEIDGTTAQSLNLFDPTARRHDDWRAAVPDPGETWPIPNIWLGVSVENQATADERIPYLLETPAALRFLSCEPLLGGVDLNRIRVDPLGIALNALTGLHETADGGIVVRTRKPWINWVIAGGESGPHARPMHPEWARTLRRQCAIRGVPFFFKQWGEWEPRDAWARDLSLTMRAIYADGSDVPHDAVPQDAGGQRFASIGKKRAGRLLDGLEHSEFPS